MPKLRILVVDDEQGMLEICAETLRQIPGTEVLTESNAARAIDCLSAGPIDLLISDVRMPEMDGIELLQVAREKDEDLPVLLLTAFPTIESAVQSIKLGAADYITKPFLPDDFLSTVRRLLENRHLRAEKRLLQRQVERPYSFDEMIGESLEMQRVFDAIERIAGAGVDVLITGETGTGKELVARSIHKQSERRDGPFVPVDCGAIPEDLLESELFGYEAGAFTGARKRSLGLLEYADGGTFFLDEVVELPLQLQAKLLRALQERRIRRLGAKQEIPVDIRIVAATHRDLEGEVAERRFREDLYYRINVTQLRLPALRSRSSDIAHIARHFLERFGREMNSPGITLDPDALEVMCSYSWPGNVRELQNVIKRALAMGVRERLTPGDLPDDLVARASSKIGHDGSGFFARRARRLEEFEREYLTDLLESHRGDVSSAAREAQVPRGTLYRLLKRHDLTPESFRR